MMDIKGVLLLYVLYIFNKKPKAVVLIMKLNKINDWLKTYTNQLSQNSKKEEFILH